MPALALCCDCSACSAAVLLLALDNVANAEGSCWAGVPRLTRRLRMCICLRCAVAALLLRHLVAVGLGAGGWRWLQLDLNWLCAVSALLLRGCTAARARQRCQRTGELVPGSIAIAARSWGAGGLGQGGLPQVLQGTVSAGF